MRGNGDFCIIKTLKNRKREGKREKHLEIFGSKEKKS